MKKKEYNRIWMRMYREEKKVDHRAIRLKKQGRCLKCEMLLTPKLHVGCTTTE